MSGHRQQRFCLLAAELAKIGFGESRSAACCAFSCAGRTGHIPAAEQAGELQKLFTHPCWAIRALLTLGTVPNRSVRHLQPLVGSRRRAAPALVTPAGALAVTQWHLLPAGSTARA
jgi:hypothetical protein